MGKAPLRIFETAEAIGEHLARQLLEEIESARGSGRHYLLGCPTGRTPRPIYGAVARHLAERPQDLSHLVLVMMDEYLVRDGPGFNYASSENAWTCHHFVRGEIVTPWNGALERRHRVRDSLVWFPDPHHPTAHDARIEDAGGIDFFILASGASDGHVAFNPPGSPRESKTRIVALSAETRRDNLATFPAFETLANVPTHGVTVGIDTIARAKTKAMVITGAGKRLTLSRIDAADRYRPEWPATIVHEGGESEIFCDQASLSPQFSR